MIYLDQASWDECHRLLKKQKQLLERLGRISERQEAGGQISTPATTNIRPKKIVNLTEEQRPPIFSVETDSVVGLEEKVQISESQINLENDSSEECSNDKQDRYTASDHKTTSIDIVIGDMVLHVETTPIDMIIGDKADMGKSLGIDNSVTIESADLAASSVDINNTAVRTVGYLSKSRSRRISESLLVDVISLAFSAKVRHSDGRTTFTIKTYIRFEYLCPYTLVLIRREFTLTNTITVTESDDDNS
ncbi:hypothetical protein ACFX1Z_028474 [Malus domestica]